VAQGRTTRDAALSTCAKPGRPRQRRQRSDIAAAHAVQGKPRHEDVVPVIVQSVRELLELTWGVREPMQQDDRTRRRCVVGQQDGARSRGRDAVVRRLAASDHRHRAFIRRGLRGGNASDSECQHDREPGEMPHIES